MRVVTHREPGEFGERARDFLLGNEAENNLMLGLIGAIEAGGYDEFWLATLEADALVGCAMQTPPFPLLLTAMPPAALPALSAELRSRRPQLEGVSGPLTVAEGFRDHWVEATGARPEVRMRQGIYRLDRVVPPDDPAPGTLRPMTEADVPLVARWMEAFQRDTGVPMRHSAEETARQRAEDGSLRLWDVDGRPVSMAASAGPTPNGIRINAVYTPPEHRGRGYASVTVAELSQRMLDEGRSFCFLYTDMDYPQSNRIYRKLGYRKVSDAVMIDFHYDD